MWLILACRLVFSHRARMMLTANLSVQDRMANGTVIPHVFANHGPIGTYFLAFFKFSLEGTQGRLLQTADGMYCVRHTPSMRSALDTH